MKSRIIEYIKSKPELYNRLYPFRRLAIPKKKIGYSRMGEDFVVEYLFDRLEIERITYLDIGANDPFIFNDTYLFYKRKERGVLIEPNPSLCKKLKRKRPTDISLNIGIGSTHTQMEFYLFDCDELDTFSETEAKSIVQKGDYHLREKKIIEVYSMNEIIEEYFDGKAPDYISFDTEGIEMPVLNTMDFEKYRPKVISVRTLVYNGGNSKREVESVLFLKSKGYYVFADSYIKAIMVREDLADHFFEDETISYEAYRA